MGPIRPEILRRLQENTKNIRNICIIAHVDHGKTTLGDTLVATNGIISTRIAGQARYLDFREDEQQRGITMENSAISLYYKIIRQRKNNNSNSNDSKNNDGSADDQENKNKEAGVEGQEYMINLIDSPGHVDFGGEVSTATRLSDGALVVVDAVEGVCPQTITVMRQAWGEKVKMILFINKVDRLIAELKLTEAEGYLRLQKVIEQANAVLGGFWTADKMEEMELEELKEAEEAGEAGEAGDGEGNQVGKKSQKKKSKSKEEEEEDDRKVYFNPTEGNVIFGSAAEGWGFRVRDFARMSWEKLGVASEEELEKGLWGDFYLEVKNKQKRIVERKNRAMATQSKSATGGKNFGSAKQEGRPLFVEICLKSIWKVYEDTMVKFDIEKVEKIMERVGITKRDVYFMRNLNRVKEGGGSNNIKKELMKDIMQRWLPLAQSCLITVIEKVPGPMEAQYEKYRPSINSDNKEIEIGKMLQESSKDSENKVAIISKMISTQRKSIVKERIQMTAEQMRAMGRRQRVENKAERQDVEEKGEEKEQEEEKEDENEEIMMGIGRVISGTVVSGEEVWLVTAQESRKMEIKSLYLVMGNEYIAVEKVSAGNIFGIGGVETYIDVEQEINRQEYVMVKLPANDNLEDKEEEKEKEKEKETANKVANYLQSTLAGSKSAQSSVAVVAPPIVTVSLEPIDISQYDQLRVGLERLEMADKSVRVEHHHSSGEYLLSATGELHLQRCVKDLTERFAKCQIHVGEPSVPFRETITSLPAIVSQQHLSADSDAGSKQFGLGTATVSTANNHVTLSFTLEPLPETVVDYLTTSAVSSSQPQSQASLSFKHKAQTVQSMLASSNHSSRLLAFGPNSAPPPTNVLLASPSALDSLAGLSTGSDLLLQALATAFQLATSAGPLCAEPMVGICVSISSITFSTDSSFSTSALSGQLITLFRDAIKSSFLTYSPRLMLATYRVNIQAPLASVGKVYPVILRRKGRILSEDILDYSPDIFCISASLPVIESFGLVDEIRSKTSGDALPQLFFSGFDPLDLDPFWVPTTIDELEDLGTVADKANLAKYYMDLVRTKKGLFVSDRKIVSSAEKQRTLKK